MALKPEKLLEGRDLVEEALEGILVSNHDVLKIREAFNLLRDIREDAAFVFLSQEIRDRVIAIVGEAE